jgi:hypothetical protein
MASNKQGTVIGVFDGRAQAREAAEALRRAGFADADITVVMHRDLHGDVEVTDLDAAKAAWASGESKAGEGAAVGAVTGGAAGAALGVATAFIPGVGPVLSIGTLAASLFGAAAGATGGGLIGAMIGHDFPEEHARYYEGELKAGRALVGVSAGDRAGEAQDILRRGGGYDAAARPAMAGTASGLR